MIVLMSPVYKMANKVMYNKEAESLSIVAY